MDRLLSEKDVVALVSLSRITLWRKVRNCDFPLPRRISTGRKAWLESEISDWISERPVADAYRLEDESVV